MREGDGEALLREGPVGVPHAWVKEYLAGKQARGGEHGEKYKRRGLSRLLEAQAR